ncbi:MAG TPA: pyridoxal-dependent decarboxylase [Myxococcaceae bacterium]|nr:pyridoxal-dependent decarboxylase [Myxococcaceae bacterium]
MTDDPRTLDPTDWEAVRSVGHRMVDVLVDGLREVREGPAWTPMPAEVKARFRAPPPREGLGVEAVWAELQRSVLPYRLGNVHPRFWARVMGTGTVTGALAGLAGAAMNNNLSGLESSAVHVEAQVVDWLKELMGFPASASGLLTSGCSLANLIGLQVARDMAGGPGVKAEGLQSVPGRLLGYASEEAHSSVARAFTVLGLGNASLLRIAVDGELRMDLGALERAVDADLRSGQRPFCVVGSAGTVNTGAADPLEALADLARDRGLWFHVDAAFGAWARLSPRLAAQVQGLERADSIAFDLHKWGAVPYGVGCVLVRDAEAHRRTFQASPAYLAPHPRGVSAVEYAGHEMGPELSRPFRALGPWMAFQEHGLERLRAAVEKNVEQAARVAARVRREPELELTAPVPLNVVTFRYRGKGLSDAQLDALNAEVVMRIQESGVAVPSTTRLRDRTVIRLAIVNHRTLDEDLDLLVDAVLETGRAVAVERPSGPRARGPA